jgi:hypothetical protein
MGGPSHDGGAGAGAGDAGTLGAAGRGACSTKVQARAESLSSGTSHGLCRSRRRARRGRKIRRDSAGNLARRRVACAPRRLTGGFCQDGPSSRRRCCSSKGRSLPSPTAASAFFRVGFGAVGRRALLRLGAGLSCTVSAEPSHPAEGLLRRGPVGGTCCMREGIAPPRRDTFPSSGGAHGPPEEETLCGMAPAQRDPSQL